MTARVDRKNIKAAEKILAQFGMTPRTAIGVFLAKVVSRKTIPFHVALPDSEYAKAEYGLTPKEVASAGRRTRRATADARRAGTLREVTGVESLRE